MGVNFTEVGLNFNIIKLHSTGVPSLFFGNHMQQGRYQPVIETWTDEWKWDS